MLTAVTELLATAQSIAVIAALVSAAIAALQPVVVDIQSIRARNATCATRERNTQQ